MKREIAVVLLIMDLVVFTGCEKLNKTPAVSKKDVVATVGKEVITLTDVDKRISRLPAYYQNMVKDRKKQLVEDMALEILLYNEARKRALQNDKEVKEMLLEAQKRILIAKLINNEVENKTTVSEKEVEEYYNTHKDEFSIPERWKASHILVKTEEEAKSVLDDLSKGRSFEDVAREKSQDTSAKRGGDIGYFAKGQMVPEFEEAAVKLEVGQTSGIVKSQFGYHIIKLTDKKPPEAQELKDASEKIKNELLQKKRRESFEKFVRDLKVKTKVTINESLLEPPKVQGPAPKVSRPQDKP